MKHSECLNYVTSLDFANDLKTKFPIKRSRKNWCHYFYIRRFSYTSFMYGVTKDNKYFDYLGDRYDLVFSDNFTLETIKTAKSIGVSMRSFTTNIMGTKKHYKIAVVTEWKGEDFS